MKKCPYCAEEIQDEAIICRYCHSDLTAPQEAAVEKPAADQPPAAETPPAKKSSALGGLGMVLVALSLLACLFTGTDNITGPAIIAVIGAVIIIFALLTGRINLFGNR